MRMDVMIDFETLGTGPLACPTRMAAWQFSPLAMDMLPVHFDMYFSVQELLKAGLEVTDETLIFWQKLNLHSLFPAFVGDMLPADEVLERFESYCTDAGLWPISETIIWAQGIDFDLTILRNLYRIAKRDFPFAYNCGRDLRTIYDVLGRKPKFEVPNFVKHNPVHDCLNQIGALQIAWSELKRGISAV